MEKFEAATIEANEHLNNDITNLTYVLGNSLDILLEKYFTLKSYGIYNAKFFLT